MLIIANQSEVAIKQYLFVTFFLSIDRKSSCFIIPFAVADINCKIFGTPFLEKDNQKVIVQIFHKHFTQFFNDQPTIVLLLYLLMRIFLSLLLFIESIKKKQNYTKPKTVQNVHLFLKNTRALVPETETNDPLLTD